MGHTKTICCQVRTINAEKYNLEWENIRQERRALIAALDEYCEGDACVPGVATMSLSTDHPDVDLMTSAYVAMIKTELAGHADDVESIRSMKAFALLFTELLGLPASHIPQSIERNDQFSIGNRVGNGRHVVNLSDYQPIIAASKDMRFEGEAEQESVRLAELLASSYNKSYLEYIASYGVENIKVVKHHLTLISDLVDQMMRLAQNAAPRDLEDHTEYELPNSHPHHR